MSARGCPLRGELLRSPWWLPYRLRWRSGRAARLRRHRRRYLKPGIRWTGGSSSSSTRQHFQGAAAERNLTASSAATCRIMLWDQANSTCSPAANPSLRKGTAALAIRPQDPLGATFDEVYSGSFFYVLWNDQFYQDPEMACAPTSNSCSSPWGHSKGMLAWDENGAGFVMQVTTPSWPASGSKNAPRQTDGNTLGCVKDDDVLVGRHFLSLKLTKDDLVKVLHALGNASVVTDPANGQIVKNGGPQDVQDLVTQLGTKSTSKSATVDTLSSGVELISKPSRLHVPTLADGIGLARPRPTPNRDVVDKSCNSIDGCDNQYHLLGPIPPATGKGQYRSTGQWNEQAIELKGGLGKDRNHAKIGVSLSGERTLSIFGDMIQQGAISGDRYDRSQNGRGGLFYVIDNADLFNSVTDLVAGDTAE